MDLAVSCDIKVAADDCLFGAPEVRFGSGIVAMVLPWLTCWPCLALPQEDMCPYSVLRPWPWSMITARP